MTGHRYMRGLKTLLEITFSPDCLYNGLSPVHVDRFWLHNSPQSDTVIVHYVIKSVRVERGD